MDLKLSKEIQKDPRRQRGQSAIEFALTLPVFLIAMFAAADLFRFTYSALSLQYSLIEGARLCSIQQSMGAQQQFSIKSTVRDLASKLGVNPDDITISQLGASSNASSGSGNSSTGGGP